MIRSAKLLPILAVILTIELAGMQALAQARETIAMLRTRYNTARNQASPQGELKAKIDKLDQDIAHAAQLGRTGELRRLYAEGMALSQNRPWNADVEFASSLALETDHVFIEPGVVPFELSQIYLPSIELAEPLTMQVTINRPATGARAGAAAQGAAMLKAVDTFHSVGRDLIESPFKFKIDFSGLDGRVAVRAELFEAGRSLGATTLNMEVHKGLHERLSRLTSSNADVRYPVDYIANVDAGNIAVGNFNYDRELTTAEATEASLKAGKDPFAGKTGDFKRHYFFEEAGEIMPYRIYVPTSYKGDREYPLIIALHGNGLTEDYFFDSLQGGLQKLAEERGYIVAAPLGYRVDGGYGYNNGSRPAEDIPKLQLSEKDVMHVLELMKKNYRIDTRRTYIAGHSMGGSGSWYLGPKYSQIWAALGIFSGGATPESAPQVKTIPEFVVHGDADTTAPVGRTRIMVAELQRLGIEHQYVEVPGGSHGGVVAPNLAGMFDFFDKHRK